jgi:predicted acyltransferase
MSDLCGKDFEKGGQTMATKVSNPNLGKKGAGPEAGKTRRADTPQVTPTKERLVSLDAFRGFIMLWLAGGDAIIRSLHMVGRNPVFNFLVYEFNHTPWRGLRFYDCIWPSFMLMVGISIPFAVAKRSKTQSESQIMWHAVRRAIILFLLGSVRESVFLGHPYLIELSSALQPIAIAYLVAFLISRKSVRLQVAVASVILIGYALLLAFVGAPGIPAGTYELNHNLVNYVDLVYLNPHWQVWPYAPEGWGTILSTIPTVSTTIFGLIIGELLMSSRSKTAMVKIIAAAGISGIALGWILSPFIPVVMKMWTTSYAVMTAGWASLMFAFFFWFIDVRGNKRWTLPLVVIGMNAIFIYLFMSIIPVGKIMGVFSAPIAAKLGSFGDLFSALSVFAVAWLLLFWMYKRNIFIKA